ncbi:MAG: hypothetical protein JNL67_02745 [Planctomycetaceae bacterium]|nr:hypothetical protein [Planctomycetaceae bacterium]
MGYSNDGTLLNLYAPLGGEPATTTASFRHHGEYNHLHGFSAQRASARLA